MKIFYLLSVLTLIFSSSAMANLTCAKSEANERISQNIKALESAKNCIDEATTETAVSNCGVDKFPVDQSAQKMEDDSNRVMADKCLERKQCY